MVTLIKRGDVWNADASGHVIHERYLREFKRKGGDLAVLSLSQFEGYFGELESTNGETVEAHIDGLMAISDRTLPKDEVHIYDGGKLIGRIVNFYVPPEPPDGETAEEDR